MLLSLRKAMGIISDREKIVSKDRERLVRSEVMRN